MFEFLLQITTARRQAGINAARAAFNNSLILEVNQSQEDHPQYMATTKDYLQFVVNSAADSYATQFEIEE